MIAPSPYDIEPTEGIKMRTYWTEQNTRHLTAEDIWRLLPPSWTFSFTSLAAALNYYRPGEAPEC